MRPDAAGPFLFWRVRDSSVEVLQIEVADFALPDVKGQPPIAADRNAPRPGALPLELMDAPAGRSSNAVNVGRHDQHRQYVAQALHKIAAQLPAVVVLNEPQQSAMPDAPNVHSGAYADTVQLSMVCWCVIARSRQSAARRRPATH